MKPTLKYFIAGIVLIFIGIIWTYLFSYKDNTIINCLAYTSMGLGCYFITYRVIGAKVKSDNLILKIIFLVFVAAGFFLFSTLSTYRESYILRHYPTKTTVAAVMGAAINSTGRTQTVKIVTFRYDVQGTVVQQDVSNSNNKYKVGQSFLIRYSVEYPEVFEIVKRME